MVPGGAGSAGASAEAGLLDWIGASAPGARRVASVCTGAFVLAAAGLLDGRRATTHWASAAKLAERHPAVEVDPDPIYVRDGNVWTSAGVTAGMDLALAMVEEDLDREAALTIARHLVLFLRRPGNQSQFSATLAAQEPEREPLRDVQRYVVEHVAENLSVEVLAEHAHMSSRNFARAFAAEIGITPGRYVERVRLEAARRALEDTSQPIATVAAACGFGTPETMRRTFLRALGVAPAEYRRRYHPDTERLIRRCPSAGRRVRPHEPPTEDAHTMDIAILIYDRFTALDAVGPYEVLSRLPGWQVTFVAEQAGLYAPTPAGWLCSPTRRWPSTHIPRSCSSPAVPVRRR